MMRRTLGAPWGGTIRDGQNGLESKALSLITPPNCSGGAGICLPSIVTVELGAPGVPLISCALAEGGTTITVIATIALSRIYEFVFIVVGGLLVGKLAHYDVDRVPLIERGAIVNPAGVVTIVSAIEHRPIGPRDGAVVACRESAAEAHGTVATDTSASVASTGYGKATSAATRSHPTVCFIARQKKSYGGEKNGDSLTEVAL